MITSRQVRAARALLEWSQELLADKALVALTALKRLESDRLSVRRDTGSRTEGARGRGDRLPIVRPRRGRHAGSAADKKTGRRGLNRSGQQSRGGDIDQTEDRRRSTRCGVD
jgi:hypothetical protein